jgi:uncharacterized protein YndB with AHSA1/START domain
MKDLMNEVGLMERTVGTRDVGGREANEIVMSRTYDAPIDDVWSACSEGDRLSRWLGPVSGDLKLGGEFQIEGNAGGEIIACEPPERVRVTWIFGDPGENPYSEVEVRLAKAGDDATTVTLTHSAVVDPEFAWQFGPGAVGVGWDLALLALGALLRGEEFGSAEEVEASPEMREYIIASAAAWGDADAAAGTPSEDAARRAAATRDFFAPPLDADAPTS